MGFGGHAAHILVADDERGMRDLISMGLGKRHQVTCVADGEQALRALADAEFDVVITDVRMPGADGIAVLKAVKETAAATEVIVITADTDVEAAVSCVRGGAFDLVQKPFELPELKDSVSRALEHRRVRAGARLYHAGQELLAPRQGEPLVARITAVAMELLHADDASVMLLDESQTLRMTHATGLSDEVQAEARLALGERVAGRVAMSREPVLLPEGLDADDRFKDLLTHGRVKSSIVSPLCHREALLGVLSINRVHQDRPFRRGDLEAAGVLTAQAALALSNEQMAQRLVFNERMSALGQLAAGIVHEVNNPLTHILANLQFISDGLAQLPYDQAAGETSELMSDLIEAASDAADGASRLKVLVADMRSMSRAGGLAEDVNVSDAVRSAVRIALPAVRQAGVVKTELDDEARVKGNGGRLSQVFLNLIVNAGHALEDASAQGRGQIVIRSRVEGDEVVVDVSDDGPGIPPELLSRIMQPFFTTKNQDRGTGLGLSISRRIVEEHGGHISAHSVVGEGTTFTVRFPAVT